MDPPHCTSLATDDPTKPRGPNATAVRQPAISVREPATASATDIPQGSRGQPVRDVSETADDG